MAEPTKPSETGDKDYKKLLDQAVNRIKEQFDCVVIIGIRGETFYSADNGNTFMQIGAVKCWLDSTGTADEGKDRDDE